MQIINSDKFIKIVADEGMKITNYDRTMFIDKIFLPVTGDPSIYEEVGRDVWKHFISEENPDITELQAQNADINETMDVIMMALANSDEQNSSAIDAILLAIDDLYRMLEPIINGGGE